MVAGPNREPNAHLLVIGRLDFSGHSPFVLSAGVVVLFLFSLLSNWAAAHLPWVESVSRKRGVRKN